MTQPDQLEPPTTRPAKKSWASIWAYSWAGVLMLLLATWLLTPVGLAVARGFIHEGRLSLYWLVWVLKDPTLMESLLNGVRLACITTAASIVIAMPLGLLRARRRFRGQGILGMLLLVPLILPPFVGGLSIRRLMSEHGALNMVLANLGLIDPANAPDWLGSGFVGVVILQTLHLFPIMYLNVSAALANVDPAYAQASRNLGAGPVATFFRITLPLIRPGLFAGGTIIFIWSFTDVGTPAILGYNDVVPVIIFKEIAAAQQTPKVFALVAVMLGASVALYVVGKFLFGASSQADSSKASIAEEIKPLGPLGTLGSWVLFGSIIFVAILPHVGVVLLAMSKQWINTVLPSEWTLEHLRNVWQRSETYDSIINSLRYAGASTAIDLLLGGTAAWLIVRAKIRGRQILDTAAMLPLAVPGLILAAGYVAMTASGPLRAIGPTGNYPFIILIIAYSVRRLPFVVRGISAGLVQIPETLEEAARNLGASRAGAVWRVTLPLLAANIVAAGVLTFAFAVLEVSDSLILAQTRDAYPITKAIYTFANSGAMHSNEMAAALGVYGMLFLGGTMALASALLGKRLGAIFRA